MSTLTRHAAMAGLILAGWLAMPVAPASAQVTYPWCLNYAGGRDASGVTNCGFSTFEQCRVSAIGNGFCTANPAYVPAQPAPQRRRRAQ